MTIKPQNLEEKLVWYTIIATYGFYFLGAQYIWVGGLAWFLMLYLCKKLWEQTKYTPNEEKITIPFTTWIWIISILIMGVTLIMGHLDFNLGDFQIISSLNEFAKSTATLALFPVIGCLNIRPQLIYRAVCIICLQSLIFIGVLYLGIALHFPHIEYMSPLHSIGHGNENYYSVFLFESGFDPLAPRNNEIRLSLFTPWAPALGLVGNIYFFLASQESNRRWRWIGMISAVAMILASVSRLAIICLPGVLLLNLILPIFTRPVTQIALGILSFLAGIFSPILITSLEAFQDGFTKARSGSSKVRRVLREIEIDRWWKEAPIWGHGIAQFPGPKTTEHMPIGSHDTWCALLFIKGAVGFMAMAVPFMSGFIDLIIKVQKSKTARVGLSILLVLFIFTFAESLETLAFTFWPGLVMLGIAFKEKPTPIKSNKEYALL